MGAGIERNLACDAVPDWKLSASMDSAERNAMR